METPSWSNQPGQVRSMWFCFDSEQVVVPGGEIADVEESPGIACKWMRRSFGEEAFGDPALIQHLDRARVKTSSSGNRPALV